MERVIYPIFGRRVSTRRCGGRSFTDVDRYTSVLSFLAHSVGIVRIPIGFPVGADITWKAVHATDIKTVVDRLSYYFTYPRRDRNCVSKFRFRLHPACIRALLPQPAPKQSTHLPHVFFFHRTFITKTCGIISQRISGYIYRFIFFQHIVFVFSSDMAGDYRGCQARWRVVVQSSQKDWKDLLRFDSFPQVVAMASPLDARAAGGVRYCTCFGVVLAWETKFHGYCTNWGMHAVG